MLVEICSVGKNGVSAEVIPLTENNSVCRDSFINGCK